MSRGWGFGQALWNCRILIASLRVPAGWWWSQDEVIRPVVLEFAGPEDDCFQLLLLG